jgi:hypothetical protein
MVKRAKGQLNRHPKTPFGYATPTEVFLGNHSEKKSHFRVESAMGKVLSMKSKINSFCFYELICEILKWSVIK